MSQKGKTEKLKAIVVRPAVWEDFERLVMFFDRYSSNVYGFVPKGRLAQLIPRKWVYLVTVEGDLAAAAIGHPGGTLWNVMVKPEFRRIHLGTLLLRELKPELIRVKCRPHKSMSAKERSEFVDPSPFYEKMGYVFVKWEFPKRFFAGVDETTGKARFKYKADMRSIKIMRKLKDGETAPGPDRSRGPRIGPGVPVVRGQKPRVRSFKHLA